MSNAILRLPTVEARTGLSRSSIYLRMAENRFPKSVKLGNRAVGWSDAEISEWIEQRIKDSRAEVEK
ncbi:MAG: helix-turn-helix transcriptional regulator [Gammaproteobacteria bacterium]